MPSVFVSYRHNDSEDVTGRIFDHLASQFGRDRLFKDVDNIPVGVDFREALSDAVRNSDILLVIIGNQWLESRDKNGNRRLDDPNDFVRIEIETALAENIPIIPVVVQQAKPPSPNDLSDSLRKLSYLQVAKVRPDPDFLHDLDHLQQAISQKLSPETPPPAEPLAAEVGECPYPGLESFAIDQAKFFFGRESLLERALLKLRQVLAAEESRRFLAVIGASGNGKSSFARAGMISAVKDGELSGSSSWPVVTFRPGHNPVESMAVALSADETMRGAVGDVGDLLERFKKESQRLHLVTRLALQGRDETWRTLILVDQFEEIFTLCTDEGLRKAFLDNLLFAANAPDGRAIVLLTMRADFYGKASAYPGLAAALSDQQILVGPMTEDELRSAIARPAELAGGTLEAGLVDLLLQDARRQSGALPFLQDCLRQLWEQEPVGQLTIASYNEMGQLDGALENRANGIFEDLNEAEQVECRRILLRLTQPGEGTEDTKRLASLQELGESTLTERTLQKLVNARLLTTTTDKALQKDFVEVSHEALIRGWPRLRHWIEEDRESIKIQHKLSAAAQDWKDNPDEALLYRGSQLGMIEEWSKSHLDDLTLDERAFLDASIALRDEQRRERQRAAARLRRRAWLAAAAALVAVACAVLATSLWWVADEARQKAEAQRQLAVGAIREEEQQRLKTERMLYNHKVRALGKAWESFDVPDDLAPQLDELKPAQGQKNDPTGWEYPYLYDRLNANYAAILTHGDPDDPNKLAVRSARWSPDGSMLASAAEDKIIRIWDAKTYRVLRKLPGHKEQISSVVWSPDGSRLASASEDKAVIVWDVATGEIVWSTVIGNEQRDSTGNQLAALDVSWNSDNQRVAVADGSLQIKVFDTSDGTGEPELLTFPRKVHCVECNPKDSRLAAVDEKGSTYLTAVDDSGKGIVLLSGASYSAKTLTVRWGPNGKQLALLDDSGRVKVWNLEGKKPVQTKRTYVSVAGRRGLAIAWNPTGEFLALVGGSGFATVWDLRGKSSYIYSDLADLRQLTHYANSVDWCSDGERLAVAGRDGKVRIWTVSLPDSATSTRQRRGSAILSFDWGGASNKLASVSGNNALKLWDPLTGTRERVCRSPRAEFVEVAFRPGGNRVAAADRGGSTIVFDTATGRILQTLRPPKRKTDPQAPAKDSTSRMAHHVAWNCDGTKLATTHGDGTIYIWDGKTDKPRRLLSGHKGTVVGLAFSGQAHQLASAGSDGTIKVWNAATGVCEVTLHDPSKSLRAVAFSSDGTRLATVGGGGVILVWEPPHDVPKLRLVESGRPNRGIIFSPDGRRLASYGTVSGVTIWDSLSGQLLLHLTDQQSDYDLTFSEAELSMLSGASAAAYLGGPTVFSPDGQDLASVVPGGAIRIWDRDQIIQDVDEQEQALSQNLVRAGSEWKYLDDGSDRGSAWQEVSFDDSQWDSGAAPLGYGQPSPETRVKYGGDSQNRHVTTYFRHSFELADADSAKDLVFGLVRDDGAAVYLNGVEVVRDNLPDAAGFETFAQKKVDRGNESKWFYFRVGPESLVQGVNILAVEIHQDRHSSSDILFDLQLSSNAIAGLLDSLENKSGSVGREAAQILSQISADVPQSIPLLLNALEDGDPLLRRSAVQALSGLPEAADQVVPRLIKLLDGAANKEPENVVFEALLALKKLAEQQDMTHLRPALTKALGSDDPVLRTAACRAIDRLRPDTSDFADLLFKRLGDDSSKVRGWAAVALAQLEPDRIISLPKPQDQTETSIRSPLANSWNNKSWDIVKNGDGTKEEHATALQNAQRACALVPDNWLWVNTLGVAEYRVGEYKQALATLAEAGKLESGRPEDLAFVAMAHYQLGETQEAKRSLDLLRKTMQMSRWASNSQARRFLADAENLLDRGLAASLLTGNLVSATSLWKYLDDGSDQGTAWREPSFDDANWEEGKATLGYGGDTEQTTVDYGGDKDNKFITTYFRHSFQVADPTKIDSLVLELLRDDGAAVYLNGTEIARDNLRPEATYSTLAPRKIDFEEEGVISIFVIDAKKLVEGHNVLAVEVHQANVTSSDIAFALQLTSDALPTLMEAIKGGDIREKAAQMIGKLGVAAKQAVPQLVDALDHRDDALRRQAAWALGQIGQSPELAVPALAATLLEDDEPEAIAEAAEAILKFEPVSPELAARVVPTLRKVIAPTGNNHVDAVWDLWFFYCVVHLKQDLATTLADWPAAAESPADPQEPFFEGPVSIEDPRMPTQPTRSNGVSRRAIQLRQIMEDLSQNRAIRINCGVSKLTTSGNQKWMADLFHLGGNSSNPSDAAQGMDIPVVFAAGRWFPYRMEQPFEGYRIPLPSGRYRVTLHLAEMHFTERGKRSFDAMLEGQTLFEDFEPASVGFETAIPKTIEVDVNDGFLNIEFKHRVNNPHVFGIEISRLDPDS